MRCFIFNLAFACCVWFSISAKAGPYSHSPLSATDTSIKKWASSAMLVGGPYSASVNAANAVGPADGGVVSLGELAVGDLGVLPAGQVTVSFPGAVIDGPGDDFVVFENAFEFAGSPNFWFAELAFVDVSTDGTTFARFPSISLNTEATGNPSTDIIVPFGRAFAGVDITNINGLAGITGPATFGGTPRGTTFDLAAVSGEPEVVSGLVDLGNIRYIRLVDIPGNGGVLDSQGNPILDAYDDMSDPPVSVNGFDLDAVGAINYVPEPGTFILVTVILLSLAARRNRTG